MVNMQNECMLGFYTFQLRYVILWQCVCVDVGRSSCIAIVYVQEMFL